MKFVLSYLLFVSVSSLYAAPLPAFQSRKVTFSGDIQYFWTDTNYDIDGDKVSTDSYFTGGEYTYSVMTSTFDLDYGFSGGWVLGGGGGFSYADSETPVNDRINSEFSDVHVYGKKYFTFNAFQLVPDIHYSHNLSDLDPKQDEVITNESVSIFQVGSWARYRNGVFAPYGYIGFQHREDGRSALMPWLAGLQLHLAYFKATAELAGFQSVTDDADTGRESTRFITNSRVNAGSLRYYSVNPSVTEIRLYADMDIYRKYLLGVMGGYTMFGENTAHGMTVGVRFTLAVDPFGGGNSGNNDDGFQPDLEEDVESSLFKPSK